MTTALIILIVAVIGILLFNPQQPNDAFESISAVTSIFNSGFSLIGGLRATSRDIAYKNCLIIGPSGSGKTSTVLYGFLNAAVRGKNSLCVLDVSGEIYQSYSGYLSTKAKIYCIDFSEMSDGFNPIEAFGSSQAEIQKLANILVRNSGLSGSGDLYWSASAENIIAVCIQVLWYQEAQYRSMINLVRLVQTLAAEPSKIDLLILKTKNDELIKSYKSIISVGQKTLQSSISTALVAISLFQNPQVARISAKTTFDFRDFRKEKSILFLIIPPLETQYMAPFTSTLFEHLFKVILEKIPHTSEMSMYVILDEMATAMRFQNLGLVYAQIRKYRGGCMGIVQDEEMLKLAWSHAEVQAIRTNSFSKIYLPGQPHATCKMLSDIIGTDDHNKPIMSASEIRTSDEAIIIVGNHKPIKEKMIPYYNHWLLRMRAALPPYQPMKKNQLSTPALLEL